MFLGSRGRPSASGCHSDGNRSRTLFSASVFVKEIEYAPGDIKIISEGKVVHAQGLTAEEAIANLKVNLSAEAK